MPTASRTEPSRFDTAGATTDPTTQLSDDEWFLIEDLFPQPRPRPNGGRPPHSNRDCFHGILFVLVTGCRWKDLPKHLPSKSVCHSRFQLWTRRGIFQRAWIRLLELKKGLKQLDVETLIGDATFIPGKKGGMRSVTPRSAKVPKPCC